MMPKDLPNAIKHLDDQDLDRLLAVAVAEAKRRGRLSSSNQTTEQSSSPMRRSPRAEVEETAPTVVSSEQKRRHVLPGSGRDLPDGLGLFPWLE